MTAQATPTVLFVCVSNAGKSVMAQHLLRRTAGSQVNALSAGTHAKGEVNKLSVQALAELGIDISDHQPTQLNGALIDDAELIVIVGTQARLDDSTHRSPIEVWNTDEPSLRGIDGIDRMRLIRDDIATRVNDLIDRLTNPTSTPISKSALVITNRDQSESVVQRQRCPKTAQTTRVAPASAVKKETP